ncbi:MAG: hypothetical protein AB7L66_15135, partial [Gemmatimonadales bacterium]
MCRSSFRLGGAAAACLGLVLAGPGARLEAQSTGWSVEAATGPAKDIAFEVTEGTWMSVSVSPDGRTILFDHLGHIYEMPVAGGTARRLTEGRSWNLFPKYSPDGASIAFSSDRAGRYDVWTMDRQGGSLRNLSGAAFDENVYRPAWSADGRLLYAVAERDGRASHLIALDRLGGREAIATPGVARGVVPEPGGRSLFIERAGPPVYAYGFNPYVVPPSGIAIDRYDLVTGETVKYLERPGGAFDATVSPDGTRLAYVHRLVDETVLIVQDLRTRAERVVLRGLDHDQQGSAQGFGAYPAIAWHPDGRRLLIDLKGHLTWVDASSGVTTTIPMTVRVERRMSETVRFRTTEPTDRTVTRLHRWGARTAQGIVSEALGDLWLAMPDGA